MSGLAVVYRLDGRPVAHEELARMAQAVAHRGPDGAGEWCEGPIGMAHRLLIVTPESREERQPLAGPQDRCRLVWDGRLDNREELLAELPGWTDPELVMAAYQRWELECVHHLIGDFAFVLWDGPRRRLVAVRDRMGFRPLVYAVADGTLWLSSEITPLLRVLPRRPEPDDAMIFAFLLREFREGDHERTFFEGVHRVPPASYLLVEDGRLQVRRYWAIDPRARLRDTRQDAIVERFRALFEEAVRGRLRSAGPIVCSLSGGMDSSSITCVAARSTAAPLEAFTIVGNDGAADERRYAQAVADATGLALHEFHLGAEEPLNGLDQALQEVESPIVGTNRRSGTELLAWLKERGVKALLLGVGGDQILDEYGYFADLLRARPWRFPQEAAAFARWCGTNPGTLLQMALPHFLTPSMKFLAKQVLGRTPPAWLNAPMAKRAGLLDRMREPRVPMRVASFAQAESYLNTFSPYKLLGSEGDEKAAARRGLEVRYPYYDSRLVEFILAIPWERRTRQGERKWILRAAMKGIVPEAIRSRQGKGDYTRAMDEGLLWLCRQDPPAPLANRSGRMDRYLNLREATRVVERFVRGAGDLRWVVWFITTMDRWLETFWGRQDKGMLEGALAMGEGVRR